jgi:hypothetical protein
MSHVTQFEQKSEIKAGKVSQPALNERLCRYVPGYLYLASALLCCVCWDADMDMLGGVGRKCRMKTMSFDIRILIFCMHRWTGRCM